MLYIRIGQSSSLDFFPKYFYFSIDFDKYTILCFIRFYHLILKIKFLIFLDILWILATTEMSHVVIYLPYFYLITNFVGLYLSSLPDFNDLY